MAAEVEIRYIIGNHTHRHAFDSQKEAISFMENIQSAIEEGKKSFYLKNKEGIITILPLDPLPFIQRLF